MGIHKYTHTAPQECADYCVGVLDGVITQSISAEFSVNAMSHALILILSSNFPEVSSPSLPQPMFQLFTADKLLHDLFSLYDTRIPVWNRSTSICWHPCVFFFQTKVMVEQKDPILNLLSVSMSDVCDFVFLSLSNVRAVSVVLRRLQDVWLLLIFLGNLFLVSFFCILMESMDIAQDNMVRQKLQSVERH